MLVNGENRMKRALILATASMLLTGSLAPATASAADLTAAQNATLSTAASKYYVAMFNGDTAATTAMEAPGYTAVTKSGKPVDMAALMGQAATVKLSSGDFAHQVKINSSTMTGNTINANITISGQASQMNGDPNGGSQRISASGQHAVTLVKSPDGSWRVQKDVFLSR
jgi:ketosteroid isomerase-like protein